MAKIIQILKDEFDLLGLGDNGITYRLDDCEWREYIGDLPTEVKKRGPNFTPPTHEEVRLVMLDRGMDVIYASNESTKFMDHYSSNGWKVGKNKMKDWRRSVSGWVTRWRENNATRKQRTQSAVERVAGANGLNTDLTPINQAGYIQPLGFND